MVSQFFSFKAVPEQVNDDQAVRIRKEVAVLLYVLGIRTPSEPVAFPVEGVDGGSISMLAVQVG